MMIVDVMPLKIEKSVINESLNMNDGRLIIKNMVIQRSDVPNKNKRIYPQRILEREVNRLLAETKEAKSRGIIGELDHPDSNVINYRNACLGILDCRWKGNDLLGDVEILNTPSGNILKEIISAGYVAGISSRGMGSVKEIPDLREEEIVEVDDDFSLLTWDAVSDPSTHNAYFKSITESKNNSTTFVKSKYDEANDIIRSLICELSNKCCI